MLNRGDIATGVRYGSEPAAGIVGELVACRAGQRVERLYVLPRLREQINFGSVARWHKDVASSKVFSNRCDLAHAYVVERRLGDVRGDVGGRHHWGDARPAGQLLVGLFKLSGGEGVVHTVVWAKLLVTVLNVSRERCCTLMEATRGECIA